MAVKQELRISIACLLRHSNCTCLWLKQWYRINIYPFFHARLLLHKEGYCPGKHGATFLYNFTRV